MKKSLLLSALLLLCVLTLCIGAFAAEKTVYVAAAGDDAADGATYRTAVKSIARAYELLNGGDGRIVLCSAVAFGADCVLPENNGTVTFTATDGKYFFPLGSAVISSSLTLSGDTIFDRVSVTASGTSILAAAGHNLCMNSEISVSGTLVLIAGYNVQPSAKAEDVAIDKNWTVTVNSGTYSYIRGGNRRVTGKSPFGTISGNLTMYLNGGEFTALDSATNTNAAAGMNNQTGNVSMIVNGASFKGSLFAVGRAGTNELDAKPAITGNVSITFKSGAFNGAKINEQQDNTMPFSGKYTLNLSGGMFTRIASIEGGATATLNMAESLKRTEGITENTFKNPLRVGADPWVIYHDGYYYMVFVSSASIKCFKSKTLDGLAYVDGVTIWSAPKTVTEENKGYTKAIWSPELHYVEESEFGPEYAGWWLYFSACATGASVDHRLYCVRSTEADPTAKLFVNPVTGESNIPVKMIVDNDETWAIGQSLLRANGKTYLMWTSETGRGVPGVGGFKQNNSIALLKNPYEVAGPTTIFNEPTFDWERHGSTPSTGNYPEVVEGATQIPTDDGSVIVCYVGSGYWTAYYAMSYLTLRKGGDPLNRADWTKHNDPIFIHQNGIFGPGHAAFTVDAAGNRWMIYHAYLDSALTKRYVFIQPYSVNGTEVEMNGGPYSADTVLTISDVVIPIVDKIKGFGN